MTETPAPPAADALERKYREALALQQQRDFAAAERRYREILDQAPAHFGALHMLGVLQYQLGHFEAAVGLIRQAIASRPGVAAAYLNLGPPLQRLRRLDEALASYDAALALSRTTSTR